MQEEISKLIQKYYDDWFAINKLYYKWAKNQNISQKTLFVLYEIENTMLPCTQRMICEHTSYPKQTVSKILNNLEKQGLLKRMINSGDKRNRIIKLTPEGAVYTKALLNEMKALEIKAFESLTEKERITVIEGFHLLSTALECAFSQSVK